MPERESLPVAAARSGDPDAWDVLFRRYELPLYAYVFESVHDREASLDIVQETFINAARHIGALQDDERFGSWLFSIAHQKCIQRWRSRGWETAALEHFAAAPPPEHDGPDDLLIRQEQEARFMEALNQLPPPQRSVLLLRFIEDFSLEEISQITETQIGTVKSRLHYGKQALRGLLEDQTE